MSTQITSKQIKVISDINFHEKEITNATIDIKKNNILNQNFPKIVTDSGDSLPVDLSSYNANDTFLNTTNKKLYMVISGEYTLNDNSIYNTSNYDDVSIDFSTGIATGFYYNYRSNQFYYSFLQRTVSRIDYNWEGQRKYNIHFKLNSYDSNYEILCSLTHTISTGNSRSIDIAIKDGYLYIGESYSGYGGQGITVPYIQILNNQLELNIEYYLTIDKADNGIIITTLSTTGYDENVVEQKTISTGIEDITSTWLSTMIICYGGKFVGTYTSTMGVGFSSGEIYLADTFGEFLIADPTTLFWDEGVNLVNKTEYVDKINKILYIYVNNELIPIGG